ncbi:MAG: hypothetical protein KAQ79_07945 [Cyclobacteriaceae bacterium]|nr:hypothetical protein [Cyclobacteriaceae bacterium]
MLFRIELDWKGDNKKFRIRHLFLLTKHWLIGKSWSSLLIGQMNDQAALSGTKHALRKSYYDHFCQYAEE